ncbi:A24 family peptidase [Salinibacterium sp. ZJ77]|uniref:prepilin peptidase n=1 Tax=Salinibacterium sp. ZJ77 TaxID=2708337 RepID=UPI0014201FCF|nr:A24 family peptidase [Salinibacterium sp. ZJ77]
MTGIIVGVIGLVGAAVGSFLNVVIWRVPRGLSIVSPASACPACGAPIRAVDNVPVVSWIALGARCRGCSAPISARYPTVEIVTAVLFALVAVWRVSSLLDASAAEMLQGVLELAALLVLAGCSVALSAIDLDVHRLPNPVVLFLAVSLLVLLGAAAIFSGDLGALLRAVTAGAAAFALLFIVAFIKPDGMGFGDVKLAGALGIVLGYFGWSAVVVGFFAAFMLGGVAGIILLALRKAARGTGIPFGPWLIAGAWVGIVAGDHLARLYLAAVGLI